MCCLETCHTVFVHIKSLHEAVMKKALLQTKLTICQDGREQDKAEGGQEATIGKKAESVPRHS